jgi:hypothetical protein
MSDERLAQMSIAALSPFPFDHPATRIVTDAFAELVAEAKRVRTNLDKVTVRAEQAETMNKQWRIENRLLRNRATNAETELAALRASLATPELQHRLIGPGKPYTPTARDLAMKSEWLPDVRHEVRDVYPGAWRPAD